MKFSLPINMILKRINIHNTLYEFNCYTWVYFFAFNSATKKMNQS